MNRLAHLEDGSIPAIAVRQNQRGRRGPACITASMIGLVLLANLNTWPLVSNSSVMQPKGALTELLYMIKVM